MSSGCSTNYRKGCRPPTSKGYGRSIVTAITIGADRSGPLTSSMFSITVSVFFGFTMTRRNWPATEHVSEFRLRHIHLANVVRDVNAVDQLDVFGLAAFVVQTNDHRHGLCIVVWEVPAADSAKDVDCLRFAVAW